MTAVKDKTAWFSVNEKMEAVGAGGVASWQRLPPKPGKQLHRLAATQVPPFWQEVPAQTSAAVWQVTPVKEDVQRQVKPAMRSVQVPPLAQGPEAHSSKLVWQRVPMKPLEQLQVNELTPGTQTPPFWQGDD